MKKVKDVEEHSVYLTYGDSLHGMPFSNFAFKLRSLVGPTSFNSQMHSLQLIFSFFIVLEGIKSTSHLRY